MLGRSSTLPTVPSAKLVVLGCRVRRVRRLICCLGQRSGMTIELVEGLRSVAAKRAGRLTVLVVIWDADAAQRPEIEDHACVDRAARNGAEGAAVGGDATVVAKHEVLITA